ncbi:MAG: hypothetical protein HY549_07740 [Elusimicrobia bacterium]|nr:hypothetical protein [Elusimicrobiota bacterium]
MPPETDNLKLQELFEADQKDRQRIYDSVEAVKDLQHRDAMRRRLVSEMIDAAQVNTPNDLYHASVIFQHGREPRDFLTAHRLAVLAAIKEHKKARWLCAATLDRFLMSVGLPQFYGTQFEHNPEENRYQLRLPIDDRGILSFEKMILNVPGVAERLNQLNGRIGVRKEDRKQSS